MKRNMLKTQLLELFKKIVNRETITYGIAGVLTTVVNFISYEGLYQLGLTNLNANAWAWVIAVAFAYIANKKNVFLSKSKSLKEELTKIGKFFGARVVTLGIEQLGMYYFVDCLGSQRLFVKAALAIIVIILNYIFSKLFVFKKNT